MRLFSTVCVTSEAHSAFKITVLRTPENQGYGGNQKLGYRYAIDNGFDIVALLHGDGQYAPEKLPALLVPLIAGEADAVFGSRMIDKRAARAGGMPLYKWLGNQILTGFQNWMLGTRLSEFHSGYRLYSTRALARIPFEKNTNDFHFDTEIIVQFVLKNLRITELPIPTYYGDEICHVNGLKYAWDICKTMLRAQFHQANLLFDRKFDLEHPGGELRSEARLRFVAHRRDRCRSAGKSRAGYRMRPGVCRAGVGEEGLPGHRDGSIRATNICHPRPDRFYLLEPRSKGVPGECVHLRSNSDARHHRAS